MCLGMYICTIKERNEPASPMIVTRILSSISGNDHPTRKVLLLLLLNTYILNNMNMMTDAQSLGDKQ
jgi:hypothetical protein